MALGLLCLGLALLGTLQIQALVPPLSKIPLQPDFRQDKFQGKWYAVSVAGNKFHKGNESGTMYTDTYGLKDDGSYSVTAILFRGEVCQYWNRTFVPSGQAGQFILGDRPSKILSYTVRVTATDYNQFAMVFFKKVLKEGVYFKTVLYGRTKELSLELRQRFVSFAKSLSLSDDNIIFLKPIDKCIDD